MDQMLADMFEQARKLVSDADRRLAEEEERRQEKEREAKLIELSSRVESSFDFTSKEKLELDLRLDLQDGRPIVEFIVRSLRAIFSLEPREAEVWALTVMNDGRETQTLGEFHGGNKADPGSRRLAAARVVTAIGNWSQALQPTSKKGPAQIPTRWQDASALPEKRELTYGTFGKFLGY